MSDLLANLQRLGHRTSISPVTQAPPFLSNMIPPPTPSYSLPLYIKPLPSRLSLDDILYLEKKGALAIPIEPMRNELLKCYAEFVHPYMPLLNIHDMIATIDSDDGSTPISLLLFQAIMFSATAFIDIRHLKKAGYHSRRDARRDFFQKTRLLYDFDIEVDRIALIQALLLMTYWYETPDDQKDSHHWMGIAVSLSHTIGLHRSTEKSTQMDDSRKKLWKRIWWSTYMRDRLIALGMRRPTRIKNSDFDVPMLTVSDFEDAVLPNGPSCIPADCKVLRSAEIQRQLAIMCIEKAKLCICISHVLSVQYSVLSNNHGVVSEEGTTFTTVRLSAKKREPEVFEVQNCDRELEEWKANLPVEAQYSTPTWQDLEKGDDSIILNRSLLAMIYYATLSALHRPQVLPSNALPQRQVQTDMLEHSRKSVRLAAAEITSVANALFSLNLTRYLPTTGITVLLPAIIIHLLDIKAPDEATRRASLQGFCQCMQVLGKLRDSYAAADYSTAFLEAAIRKAEITLPQKPDEVKEPRNVITSSQGLVDAGRRIGLLVNGTPGGPDAGALTPPPDDSSTSSKHQRERLASTTAGTVPPDALFPRTLNSFLVSTPPDSDEQSTSSAILSHGGASRVYGMHNHHQHHSSHLHVHDEEEEDDDLPPLPSMTPMRTGLSGADATYITIPQQPEFESDFESFINLDAAGDVLALDEGAFAAMSGESGGFTMDMDWLKGMKDDGLDMASGMEEA